MNSPIQGSANGALVETPGGRRLVLVDHRVRDSLCALARRHSRRGVRVFLFGSIARTWPQATLGADFDLGYEIAPSRVDRETRRRELERDLALLPSIRPVDLVDFSEADEAFRAEATKHIVELAHEPLATAAD